MTHTPDIPGNTRKHKYGNNSPNLTATQLKLRPNESYQSASSSPTISMLTRRNKESQSHVAEQLIHDSPAPRNSSNGFSRGQKRRENRKKKKHQARKRELITLIMITITFGEIGEKTVILISITIYVWVFRLHRDFLNLLT